MLDAEWMRTWRHVWGGHLPAQVPDPFYGAMTEQQVN